jgi:hypothetical protein
LYVRQEAYYQATPDGAKLSRAEQIERGNTEVEAQNNSDDDSVELMDKPEDNVPVEVLERQEIPMPELSPGSEYLVAFLHSAGTATSTGMGLTGLSWQELEAWARCTDNTDIVTPRDLTIIHALSRTYASEYSKASKKGAKPPYVPVVEEENIEVRREIVSQKADDLFASMIAAQNNRG